MEGVLARAKIPHVDSLTCVRRLRDLVKVGKSRSHTYPSHNREKRKYSNADSFGTLSGVSVIAAFELGLARHIYPVFRYTASFIV